MGLKEGVDLELGRVQRERTNGSTWEEMVKQERGWPSGHAVDIYNV